MKQNLWKNSNQKQVTLFSKSELTASNLCYKNIKCQWAFKKLNKYKNKHLCKVKITYNNYNCSGKDCKDGKELKKSKRYLKKWLMINLVINMSQNKYISH